MKRFVCMLLCLFLTAALAVPAAAAELTLSAPFGGTSPTGGGKGHSSKGTVLAPPVGELARRSRD